MGIISYSWLVSNISNIIQEKNKLYRHLEYIHLNQKHNPKILIDNLPYTIKNNLLNEMYKPIINNLVFLKISKTQVLY